ncbi:MAG TPA: hydroxyacid dehydrogenase [Azospirillaceae bacterium]|nr:hydroxyacid dehydrogenase [Azospirillaceae bacterium]
MPDIVITEFMDEAAVAALSADFDVRYDPKLVDRPDELAGLAAGAKALIVRNRTQVREPLIEAAGRLVAIGRLGVGLDNIDVVACRKRGIQVLPATGANDVSVAEYVITGVLMLLRGAFGASSDVAAGLWPRERLIGRETAGKVLGLIGFGSIARAVAHRAAGLGMEVVAYDPYVDPTDSAWARHHSRSLPLDQLLAISDAVSLHVPLSPETHHLLDAARLGRMRQGAVLINAARGGVIDEPALADAVRRGHLAGALLDVFETEPLGADNPFSGLANIWLTPHVAGVTLESNERVSAVTAENVRRALQAAFDEGRA